MTVSPFSFRSFEYEKPPRGLFSCGLAVALRLRQYAANFDD